MDEEFGNSPVSNNTAMTAVESISDDQELFLKVLENLKNAVNLKPDKHSIALPKYQKSSQDHRDSVSIHHAADKDLKSSQTEISTVESLPRSDLDEPGTTTTTVSDKTKSRILQKITVTNELEKIKAEEVGTSKPNSGKADINQGTSSESQLNLQVVQDSAKCSNADRVTVTLVGIDQSKNEVTERNTTVFNSKLVECIRKSPEKVAVTPLNSMRPVAPAPAIQLYTCSLCDYYSENKNYLKQHMDLVHNNDRPYKCPYCEYAGKRSHALREHLIVHSNERPFQCKSCNATFRKKGHLTNHVKLHNSKRLVKCPLCKILIYDTGENGLDAHLKNEHDTERLYGCDLCDHIAANEPEILEHLRSKHKSKLVAYKCDRCPFQTSNTVDFNSHMDAHTMTNMNVQVGSNMPGKVVAVATLPIGETLTEVPNTAVKIGNSEETPSQAAVIKPVWIKCSECGFTAQDSEVIKKHMLEHLGMEVVADDPKQHVQQILTPINQGLKHNSPQLSSASGNKPPVLVPVTNVESLFPQHAGKLDLNAPILVPVSDLAMLKSLQSMPMSSTRRSTPKLVQLNPSVVSASTEAPSIVQQTIKSVGQVFTSTGGSATTHPLSKKPFQPSPSVVPSTVSIGTPLGVTSSPTLSSPIPSVLSKQPVIPLQKHQMQQLLKNPNLRVIPVTGPQSSSASSSQMQRINMTSPLTNLPQSSGQNVTVLSDITQSQTTAGIASPLPTSGFKLSKIPVPRNLTPIQPPKLPQEILSLKFPIEDENSAQTAQSKQNELSSEDQKVVALQENLANIQQLIEEQNKLNKKVGHPLVKLDAKGLPEPSSNQKVVYYLSPVDKQNTVAKNVKNAGFTHDSNAGRFKCTLCGYTCEYQRTIKAHVWKHSGNKNIDYPMFQNGPLSIYDDGHYSKPEIEEIREEGHDEQNMSEIIITTSESVCGTDVMVKPTTESNTSQLSGSTSKLPPFIVYDKTRISNVAPALANLLAARAMANMSSTGEENESGTTEDKGLRGLQVELDPQSIEETIKSKEKGVLQRQARPSENMATLKLTGGNVSSIKYTDQVQTIHNVDSGRSVSNDGGESHLQTPCNANVVVEVVNSVNTSCGYTGLQSQQNSPRITPAPRSPDSGVSELTLASKTVDDKSSSGMTSPIPYLENINETEGIQTRLRKRKFVESKTGMDSKIETEDPAKKSKSQSLEDSAVTLLSLLKKGPNYNPACPPKSGTVTFVGDSVNTPSPSQEDTGSTGETEPKPKSGISTSLLAVIEQLRERSKSDLDDDKPQTVVTSKKTSKRRSRRSSMEENESAAGIENVEQFDVDGQAKFRCKLCHYTNESTLLLKQHMRLHKPKQEFECSLCDLIAESSEALQDHMIQHCKVRTYQCKLCNSAFNYKSQLRAHMRMHNDQDILLCDFCDFETRSAAALKTHIKSHLTKPPYKCDICKEEFITSFNLRIHKREGCYTSLDKLGHFKCDECDYTSLGRREMKNHQKVHLGRSLVQQQKGCPYCDYTGLNLDQIQQHIADNHGESKTLKCELCGFVAVSIRSLKSHMKRHVNDQRFVAQPLEQYKCNLCGYVCHHLPSLKSHMWRHAADQHYSYEFTNDVINAAIDFDSRIDAVDTTKDHVNNFRKLIFDRMKSKGLESTRNTQEESAAACCWVTFRCCQCGFETINKAELNMHMTAHSDIIKWTLSLDVSEEDSKQEEVPMMAQEQVVPFVETAKSVPQIMNA